MIEYVTGDLFESGGMDRQLLPRCREMCPCLDVLQLPFLVDRLHAVMADLQPDQLADLQMEQARRAQCEADFTRLEAKILSEETAFMEYLATVTEFTDRFNLAVLESREQAAHARETAVKQHLQRLCKMAALPDRSHMPVSVTLGFRELCGAPPAKSVESVLKINVVSMPALGVQHSLHAEGIVRQAAEDLAANPQTSTWIILCPNTPMYGTGCTPGGKQEFHEAVAESGRCLEAKLISKVNLKFKLVTGQLAPESVQSLHREWRVDFYMVVSSQTDESGALASQWTSSQCWIRRTLSCPLQAMGRAQYRNWGSPIMLDGARLDWAVEYRQHFTGVDFWSVFLLALCSNGLASPNLSACICDQTLCDPELAKAVVNLQAVGGNFPKFSYLGLTHCHRYHSGSGDNIVSNAWFALVSHTISMVEAGTLTLPGCIPLVTGVHGVTGVVPAVPSGFDVCVPCGRHLPIKQAVHDWWNHSVDHKVRFEALVKTHNVVKGFNPGGVPFKRTRAADTSVQDLERSTRAISVPRAAGQLDSLSSLESRYPDGLRKLALSGSISLIVADDRSAYIVNVTADEITVDKDEPLLRIKVGIYFVSPKYSCSSTPQMMTTLCRGRMRSMLLRQPTWIRNVAHGCSGA